jgi:aspartate/methionine/tyrosine aminotransferase
MGRKVDEVRNPSGQLQPKSFVNPVIAAMEQVGTVYAMIEERDGYALDFGKIKAHISDRTKLILLSSPVNPTGYVSPVATWSSSRTWLRRGIRNLLLVSDESYDRMVYDRLEHISPYHFFEGRSRTILVKSFTKSYALPTWRVCYIIATASWNRMSSGWVAH